MNRAGRHKVLSPEDRVLVLTMRKYKWDVKDIASKFNVSKSSIWRVIAKKQ